MIRYPLAHLVFLLVVGPGCIYIPLKETPGGAGDRHVDARQLCGADRPIHPGVTRDQVHELLGTPSEVCTSSRGPFVRETYQLSNLVNYFYLFADSPIGTKLMLKEYKVVVEYSNGELVSDCRVRAD